MDVILLPTGLFLAALLLRVNDIFVLRLDERWGEIFLSKSLGLLLVLFYTRASGRTVTDLGLHGRFLGKALLVSAVAVVPVYLAAYGLQFAALAAAGKRPALAVMAIDPKTGLAGGLLFAIWLLVGNVVNSFMEEGLFRGVMLPNFGSVIGPWRRLGRGPRPRRSADGRHGHQRVRLRLFVPPDGKPVGALARAHH